MDKTLEMIIVIAFFLLALANTVIGIRRKRMGTSTTLHRKYLMQVANFILIVVCITELLSLIDPSLDIKANVLKGSALVVAILGFAAQPVIADIICGLLISIHKPFEIGDRIIVEDAAGTVEDVTLRHTVVRITDGHRVIIPNSVMNSKVITNSSYHMKDRRGLRLQFSVSYDTDVQKAMDVIRDCVEESPYTLGVETNGIREDSGPVYFLTFGDSALVLDTTIWVTKDTVNEKAITDVNLRVLNAFRRYGIEIPYPYFNLVQFEGKKEEAADTKEMAKRLRPAKRQRRSNTVHMEPGENLLEEAVQIAESYAAMQSMDRAAAMQLELLMEESVGFVQSVAEQTKRDFWIEGTGVVYRIHVSFAAKVGSAEYKKLLDVSSSGKNMAANSFSGWLWNAVLTGMKNPAGNKGGKSSYKVQLSDAGISEAEIGKSILGALASDISVSVTAEKVELIISKNYG